MTEKVMQVRDCWKTVAFQPMTGWVNVYGVSRDERSDGGNIAFFYTVPCPGFITQELLGTATSIKRDERFYTRYEPAQEEWDRADQMAVDSMRIVPAVVNDDVMFDGKLEPAGSCDYVGESAADRQYLTTLPENKVLQYIARFVEREDASDLLISEWDARDKWLELRGNAKRAEEVDAALNP